MTFKEFVYNVICPQATPNGNSVAIDDFNREGTKEYCHPKEFTINGDRYYWSISKRHTKGRHLSNHYEIWFHGKAFNNTNSKVATGVLTKGKLKKGYRIIYDYYYKNRHN